jgi:hypothetical protein
MFTQLLPNFVKEMQRLIDRLLPDFDQLLAKMLHEKHIHGNGDLVVVTA